MLKNHTDNKYFNEQALGVAQMMIRGGWRAIGKYPGGIIVQDANGVNIQIIPYKISKSAAKARAELNESKKETVVVNNEKSDFGEERFR